MKKLISIISYLLCDSYKVIKEGNGAWYHGIENPIYHKWEYKEKTRTCSICGQIETI